MTKREIKMGYGATCRPLEKQANEQGYTFGEQKEHYQTLIDSLVCMRINSIISDREYDRILYRFNKHIAGQISMVVMDNGETESLQEL